MNYLTDAKNCSKIIDGRKFDSLKLSHINTNYGTIYKHTNEDLDSILSNFSFKGKDVLSVLASSEHVFSAYYLGARNVDTFDKNILTYYYFFLKKWLIMNKLDRMNVSNNALKQIIESHDETTEEIKAYKFWKYILLHNNTPLMNNLNLFCSYDSFKGRLPYNNNSKKFAKIIKSKKPNFTHLDLFKRIPNIGKTYSIILLSNILEYLHNKNNSILNEITSQNIYDLLEDDGIAICSKIKLFSYEEIVNSEFLKIFDFIENDDKSYILKKKID